MNELVYGKNSFNEALASRRIIKAYVINDSYVGELNKMHIPYEICARKVLDKMSKGANHQGVIAEVKQYKMSKIEDMIKSENGLIVILDSLKDVHNLGAIIRTCDAAQVDGVIYKSHNSVKVNDTVAKVASGALEYVKVAEVNNLVNTIKYFKENGYWIVGTGLKTNDLYTDIDYKMNTVLVIGSEEKGISRLVEEECDYLVKIPMGGHVDSLNASVAAGIMIYNVLASRRK